MKLQRKTFNTTKLKALASDNGRDLSHIESPKEWPVAATASTTKFAYTHGSSHKGFIILSHLGLIIPLPYTTRLTLIGINYDIDEH